MQSPGFFKTHFGSWAPKSRQYVSARMGSWRISRRDRNSKDFSTNGIVAIASFENLDPFHEMHSKKWALIQRKCLSGLTFRRNHSLYSILPIVSKIRGLRRHQVRPGIILCLRPYHSQHKATGFIDFVDWTSFSFVRNWIESAFKDLASKEADISSLQSHAFTQSTYQPLFCSALRKKKWDLKGT